MAFDPQATDMRPTISKHQLLQAHQRWQAGQKAEKSGKWLDAAKAYTQAARLAPQESLYWMNLSSVQLQLGLGNDALASARHAHQLSPDNVIANKLLAATLSTLHRHSEAANVWAHMPSSVTRDADFFTRWSHALLQAQRWQEAVIPCVQLLKLDMFNPAGHLHMGMAMLRLNRPGDAALCFETAIATDKSGETKALALSQLVDQLRYAAKWEKLPQFTAQLLQALDESSDEVLAQIVAFSTVAIEATPQQQLRVAQLGCQRATSRIAALPPRPNRVAGPLRIGYLSCDFHEHATALLMVGLLEQHDRNQVEVTLYCHSPEDGKALQQRVRAAAHRFRDVKALSDAEVAQLMRDDQIDIAIDLKGQTTGSRYQILAYRPAPIQINYLGFPGSSGAPFLDYIIGDPVVTPLEHAAHFSERIAQMPHSYQPNDAKRVIPAKPQRSELGLPEDAVVLCCFNQIYKISPDVADAWAAILNASPNAVLWLLIWSEEAAGNVAREMQARGVAPERLFFSPKVSSEDNQARLQCADLFLDTWPCNAHTTASDALWSGVPVITVPGQTFASRVAASLVQACHLPDLVCESAQQYVQKAIALCASPAQLSAYQTHLITQRQQLPLFDDRQYAKDFDALLLQMWARHEAKLPPNHIPATPRQSAEVSA